MMANSLDSFLKWAELIANVFDTFFQMSCH